MKEMLAIYIHLRQTLIGQPAITSVAAGVAVCCRIWSTTVNRLISAADIVSYLMQNSRLLDDICGPVVEVNSGSVAKICGVYREVEGAEMVGGALLLTCGRQ